MIQKITQENMPELMAYGSSIFLLGSGGFGREVAWCIRNSIGRFANQIDLYFVNDDKQTYHTKIDGIEVIGSIEDIPHFLTTTFKSSLEVLSRVSHVLCAIGTPKLKKAFANRVAGLSFSAPVLHKSVNRGSPLTDIGTGSVICAGTNITCNVKIGYHVGINLNCTVGHDSVIEDYVQINPGCNISGHVRIKEGAELGTNVSVIPGVTIGEGCIVGAGSVVTKDLPPWTVCVGTPCKPIKDIEHG